MIGLKYRPVFASADRDVSCESSYKWPKVQSCQRSKIWLEFGQNASRDHSPDAVVDLNSLSARIRSEVRDSIDKYLRHEPKKVSKSRIKRLRGFSKPQYRLRVNEVRVFYDVSESTVEILAIVDKANAEEWLQRYGEP